MIVLFYIFLTLFVFCFMEAVTWFTHKYIMHGFMWYFHEDHHQPGYPHPLEKNDFFFVIFAIPAIVLFYFGLQGGLNYLFFIGLGITLYGLAYFIVHDVLIHRRFKWFQKTKSPYLLGLRKAHKIHHKYLDKEDGECFGMLFVPLRYFREAFRSRRKLKK